MDQVFIREMKEKLEAEREELRKRLDSFGREDAKIKDDFHSDFPSYGDKEEDNATEVAQYQDNLALEGRLEERLKEIEAAAGKIEKGGYGVCENCGREIAKERLAVNPAAKVCVSCQA